MTEREYAQYAGRALTPVQFQQLIGEHTDTILHGRGWRATGRTQRLQALGFLVLAVADAGKYRTPGTWRRFVAGVRAQAARIAADLDLGESPRPKPEPLPFKLRARFYCPGERPLGQRRVPCRALLPFGRRAVTCSSCGLAIPRGADVALDEAATRRLAAHVVVDVPTGPGMAWHGPRLGKTLRRRGVRMVALAHIADTVPAPTDNGERQAWAGRSAERLARHLDDLHATWQEADARARASNPRGPCLVPQIATPAEKAAWRREQGALAQENNRTRKRWRLSKPRGVIRFQTPEWAEAESLREHAFELEHLLGDLQEEAAGR